MEPDVPREPVSARVKKTTKKALEAAAKEYGLSIGSLVGNILDDYVAYLESKPSKRKD